MALAIVLMGVSGCGKTSVGNCLAEKLSWPFFDGDDFHPKANVVKMTNGFPLNDDDRQPWLERLHELMKKNLSKNQSLIVACSALKAKYRQTLSGGFSAIRYVHLVGSFDVIFARMQKRSGHYMKAEMLRSQFKDLEPPQNALSISIDQSIEIIAANIIESLQQICES